MCLLQVFLVRILLEIPETDWLKVVYGVPFLCAEILLIYARIRWPVKMFKPTNKISFCRIFGQFICVTSSFYSF